MKQKLKSNQPNLAKELRAMLTSFVSIPIAMITSGGSGMRGNFFFFFPQ